MKVWIVTKTYGLTIEGDTEVRGVYANEEDARAAVARLGDLDAETGEYEVREMFDPDELELSAWEL